MRFVSWDLGKIKIFPMPDIYIAPQKKSAKRKEKGKKFVSPKAVNRLTKSLAKIGIKPGTYPLGAFVPLPKKISFEAQEKKEKIVLLLRRHWSTNIFWCFLILLMALSPFILTILPFSSFLPFRFRLIIIIMWYLFVLGISFEKFLSWFFNVFIITDERVIDVDFFSLVYREVSQAKIDKIQDVTYKSGGLLRSIFNYGDVFIQTAGKTQQIEFESVPQPAKVVQVLNHLMAQEEQEKVEGRIR